MQLTHSDRGNYFLLLILFITDLCIPLHTAEICHEHYIESLHKWIKYMKSFIAKRVNSILVNLRYLRFKLLKYKNNEKFLNTFDHNFKNIHLYIIMRKVSLER